MNFTIPIRAILYLTSAILLAAHGHPAQHPDTFSCHDCDHVISTSMFDARKKGVKPGDTVCLVGTTHQRITIRNISGTKEKPVIIKNCNGTARIISDDAFGLKFQHSKHFKLIGDGGPDKYGIVISTQKGFFLTMESFTTDFEISQVEIAGPTAKGLGNNPGFAGIGVKTSPYQDCDLFTDSTRQAWIMKNVKIHHNYIHDTGGEGLYIGHGFYKGRKEKKCPDQGLLYSHSIKDLYVYDNRIENVGYDGIQIKNADENVEVHHNLIHNYGTRNKGAHNEGLFIGEGTTGRFYSNIIDRGTGNGIKIQGIGNLDVYDNMIMNSGTNGIHVSSGEYVYRLPDGYFKIFHNTIRNSEAYALLFYNNDGGPKKIFNNLVINATALTKKGANVEFTGNIISRDATHKSQPFNSPLKIEDIGIQDLGTLDKCQKYLQQSAF